MNTILTVTQVNTYCKSLLDSDENLRDILISGEISNLADHYATGHLYFTLKDEESVVKCVMFKSYAQNLRFQPRNAMRVLLRGSVSVFLRNGAYQIYVSDMQPDGMGALHLAFEQLKEKLAAEGLFAPERKRSLPVYPRRIGVITSMQGAAVRDILSVAKTRFPYAQIVTADVLVQGDKAPGEIVRAIETFDQYRCADVLIVGRGGGSLEDLWAFNDERVARAVAGCGIPVISAVGHETDFTICDFAADVRAATPSNGAEMATPSVLTCKAQLRYYQARFVKEMKARLQRERGRVQDFQARGPLSHPLEMIRQKQQELDAFSAGLRGSLTGQITGLREQLAMLAGRLSGLNPLDVLSRGYSLTYKEGRVVSRADEISPGDLLKLRMSGGAVTCLAEKIDLGREENE